MYKKIFVIVSGSLFMVSASRAMDNREELANSVQEPSAKQMIHPIDLIMADATKRTEQVLDLRKRIVNANINYQLKVKKTKALFENKAQIITEAIITEAIIAEAITDDCGNLENEGTKEANKMLKKLDALVWKATGKSHGLDQDSGELTSIIASGEILAGELEGKNVSEELDPVVQQHIKELRESTEALIKGIADKEKEQAAKVEAFNKQQSDFAEEKKKFDSHVLSTRLTSAAAGSVGALVVFAAVKKITHLFEQQ